MASSWFSLYSTIKTMHGPINIRFTFVPYSIFIHSSFINSAVCLTTGPQPLRKPVLHTVRSSVSSFNFQYPTVSLRSSSSRLRLLPRLPVIYIFSYVFLSITRFRRKFLLIEVTKPIILPSFYCL